MSDNNVISTKYPRTYHLPLSKGVTNDDKIVRDDWFDHFKDKEIVITEKLDGSNTALTYNGVFSRSHAVQTQNEWDKYITRSDGLYNKVKGLISENEIVYGENLYAVHSIEYNKLPSYFFIFNIRDDKEFYSWDEISDMAEMMDIPIVPLLWRGILDSIDELIELTDYFMSKPSTYGDTIEGLVIRISNRFPIEEFKHNVVKYVRANHVQTGIHWSRNWKKAKLYNQI